MERLDHLKERGVVHKGFELADDLGLVRFHGSYVNGEFERRTWMANLYWCTVQFFESVLQYRLLPANGPSLDFNVVKVACGVVRRLLANPVTIAMVANSRPQDGIRMTTRDKDNPRQIGANGWHGLNRFHALTLPHFNPTVNDILRMIWGLTCL